MWSCAWPADGRIFELQVGLFSLALSLSRARSLSLALALSLSLARSLSLSLSRSRALSLSLARALSLSLCLSRSLSLSGRREDRRTCISPLTVHSQEYTASPEAEFSPDGVFILALNPCSFAKVLAKCNEDLRMRLLEMYHWWYMTISRSVSSRTAAWWNRRFSHHLHNGINQTLFCALYSRTFLR